jgi:hypothetical protein
MRPVGAVARNFYAARCNSYFTAVALTMVLMAAAPLTAAMDERALSGSPRDTRIQTVQQVVDSLRERLGITAVVTVTVVEHDARRMSVRREPGDAVFGLSVERALAEQLPPAQLEAALAHELGHVWIYTHHPYLQTEQLANRVAMRAVPRTHLVAVYSTLWGADAVHGSLEAFLGLETTTAAQD